MRILLITLALAAAGCGNYSEFKLPQLNTAGTIDTYHWEANRLPVIERGDLSDVLNPSVVGFQGEYWNLYSEFEGEGDEGAWHTAVATSPDGIVWMKQGRILSPGGDASEKDDGTYIAANGSALVVDGEIYYWYEVGYPLRIALAKSKDGKTWTRQPGYVLETGPYGDFDERAVADPYVVRVADYFYLYFLGQDRAGRQTLGVARSKDGVAWEKLRSNPVLRGTEGAFDENLGEPAVWNAGGHWWMLYTARARDEQRRMGLARSDDGIAWTRVPEVVIEGQTSWNYAVVCDPSVEPQPDGTVRVWFGGGSIPKPDQGIDGEIGLGWLRPGPAPKAEPAE